MMNISAPIVIDLGQVRNAQIDELFRESGQLLEDVNEVLRLVRLKVVEKPGTQLLFPIVAVYHLEETTAAKQRKPRKLIKRIVRPG
jgi:hypothetical protein